MSMFTPEKKCPFCGFTRARIASWTVQEHIEYAVMCLYCGALGPNDLGRSGAVEAWDVRCEAHPSDADETLNQKFSTKEGIEIEVQIFEDGLADGYVVLDFIVYVRVPGYNLSNHTFQARPEGGDFEIYTTQRREK